jgi:hypothetical protein
MQGMRQLGSKKNKLGMPIRYSVHESRDKYRHPKLTDNQIEGFMKYWSTEEPSHVALLLQMMDKRGL